MGILPLELAKHERRNPTWAMALTFPDQGGWTVTEYLDLDIGRHVEFEQGCLELLPMPDNEHQDIAFFIAQALKEYANEHGGRAAIAPLPMMLWKEKFREPDVMFMKEENVSRLKGKYWHRADLAVEIVSKSNKSHDLQIKRAEYAKARIPEYWIVDPRKETITVLALKKNSYAVHGEFKKGQKAASKLIPGFSVDVKAALEAR